MAALSLWLLLGVALPAALAFIATRWRKRWVMVALIVAIAALTAGLIWLLLRNIIQNPDTPETQFYTLIHVVYLLCGTGGAITGLLLGWWGGRAARNR